MKRFPKTKINQLVARQGDVAFIQCKIPAAAKRIPVKPFALGEVTGHSHRLTVADVDGVEMYELDGRGYLRVTKDGSVSIQHEDHDPAGEKSYLPSGWEGTYRIAREYDDEQRFRSVID